MSELLYKFPRPLHRAKITARPSASNKSPYLVDVVLHDDPTQEPQIAHNPALLCGGRLDKGAIVYVMASPPESKGLSKYQVMLLEAEQTLIITNTQYGNHIAAEIIKQGYLGWIPETLKAEVTHGESRFDFGGSRASPLNGSRSQRELGNDFGGSSANKQDFFIEVKSVPLLDTAGKAAIFPVGNRKHKADDPVSPRAVKHAEHLTALTTSKTHKTTLLFLAMRPDPTHFQISTADITYNNAIRKAHEAGVALCAFSVRPTSEGEVYFEKALDVHI
jgi:DNA-binding sugar fermentation-stimulating protein